MIYLIFGYVFIGIVLGMLYGMIDRQMVKQNEPDWELSGVGGFDLILFSSVAWLPILCAACLFYIYKKAVEVKDEETNS